MPDMDNEELENESTSNSPTGFGGAHRSFLGLIVTVLKWVLLIIVGVVIVAAISVGVNYIMTAFSLCVLGTMVSEKFVFRQKIRRRIRLLFACSWDTNRTTKQFRRRWSVRIRILKLKYASIFRKNGLMS